MVAHRDAPKGEPPSAGAVATRPWSRASEPRRRRIACRDREHTSERHTSLPPRGGAAEKKVKDAKDLLEQAEKRQKEGVG